MNEVDALGLLRQKVDDFGQGEVAKRLGYSKATVSLVINDKYNGNLNSVLLKVKEVFGGLKVNCPVLGEIDLAECAENKRQPFSASNPLRVRLFKACKACEVGR
ncbi:helix-turn-helix domain-containing protein [Desulforegula conservatrix]|uniref:helix-turn-helix domain-containing protein n=1 Tax=Desulforegula conservatrix TaxID=153026 RepID=UPI00041AB05C|nr:helix-turn-helix domain-containing protein [Desulforegula conservatrix]